MRSSNGNLAIGHDNQARVLQGLCGAQRRNLTIVIVVVVIDLRLQVEPV